MQILRGRGEYSIEFSAVAAVETVIGMYETTEDGTAHLLAAILKRLPAHEVAAILNETGRGTEWECEP